jgi:hypothetical protein
MYIEKVPNRNSPPQGSPGNADLVGEIWHDFILVNICPYACYLSLSDYQYFGFWA